MRRDLAQADTDLVAIIADLVKGDSAMPRIEESHFGLSINAAAGGVSVLAAGG